MIVLKLVIAAVIAYLLGAIPFGLLIGKLIGNVDVTQYGSHSIGGTNVLRTVGTKAGTMVVACDLAKAALAVWLAGVIVGKSHFLLAGFPLDWNIVASDPNQFTKDFAQVLAGMMAMIGHNWSVYIGFRGGKGVATYIGGWLVIYTAAGLFGGVILLYIALRTRYMSMGSILGSVAILALMTILTAIYEKPFFIATVYSFIATIMIIYRHRQNIWRLQTGKENEFIDQASKHGSETNPT